MISYLIPLLMFGFIKDKENKSFRPGYCLFSYKMMWWGSRFYLRWIT